MRLILAFLLALSSAFAVAQEMTEMRSEFFYCTLNDGKTMEDVRQQSKRYGEFSKENGTHYTQAILLPMHAGETDYDYITWGTWPDGEAMYKEWGSFANSYDGAADEVTGGAAGTCRNSVATFFNLVARIPMEIKDRDAKRPAQFSLCTLKEGVTLNQVAEQEIKNVKQMEEAGFKGLAVAYHLPYMGFNGTPDFDFALNYFWYSFDARAHAAKNFAAFAAENPEGQDAMKELVSCEGGSSFVFETMFNNLPDTEG